MRPSGSLSLCPGTCCTSCLPTHLRRRGFPATITGGDAPQEHLWPLQQVVTTAAVLRQSILHDRLTHSMFFDSILHLLEFNEKAEVMCGFSLMCIFLGGKKCFLALRYTDMMGSSLEMILPEPPCSPTFPVVPHFSCLIHRWGDTPDVSSLLWGRGVQDLPGDMAGKS